MLFKGLYIILNMRKARGNILAHKGVLGVCSVLTAFLLAIFSNAKAVWAAPSYGNVNNSENSLYMSCLKKSGDAILGEVGEYVWRYTHSSGVVWDHTFSNIKVSKNNAITWGCMLYAIDDGEQACMMWLSSEGGSKDATIPLDVVVRVEPGDGGVSMLNLTPQQKTVYLNGMCTNVLQGAVNIKSNSSFLSIGSSNSFSREAMPNVGSLEIRDGLNVKELMNVATVKEHAIVGNNTYSAEYLASANIERCNAANTNSCSSGDFPIRVLLNGNNAFSAESNFGAAAEQNSGYVSGDGYARRGWSSTGFVKTFKSIANDNPNSDNANDHPLRVKVGEKVQLTFSHRIRSDESYAKVIWGLKRTSNLPNYNIENGTWSEHGNSLNDGYKIVRSCIGTKERKDDWWECDGENKGEGEKQGFRHIDADNINIMGPFRENSNHPLYTDGEYYYNARDVYDVRFTKKGEYKFCESISVPKGLALTEACVIVTVDDSYNFENEASAEIKGEVYAGENVNVDTEVKVKSRFNERIGVTYITAVDDAEVRLITFVSNNGQGGKNYSIANGYNANLCSVFSDLYGGKCDHKADVFKGVLNADMNDPGIESNRVGGMMNIYDVPAGKYYCVATAVYPYITGDADAVIDGKTPWNIYPDSYSWYISKPDCKQIGKKPSLQVWGAGMYTAGEILANNAEKRVIDGKYSYVPKGEENTTVFGTWVEQNIIANGKINIASGAATGRKGNDFGGSREGTNINVCVRSPLTMPNKDCSQISNPGSLNSMNKPNDKEKLINKLDNKCEWRASSPNGASVGNGESRFYCSNNDFNISGDVIYADNYSLVSEIPKVIIYSKKNIVIGCGVRRIDAVLIAEGNVYTCDKEGVNNGVNASKRSNQLKINGAVIANKMIAGRTYGAATGVNSGTPAEIINYDTSLYLWGSSRSDVTKTGKLKVVYQTELAPRL